MLLFQLKEERDFTSHEKDVARYILSHNEKIRQWCHETVEIPNRDSILSLDVITSFAAANYVLDIFFSMLLARRQEEHIKSSVEMLKHRELLVNRPELLQ